jgi:SAM-dependent methyltransferase
MQDAKFVTAKLEVPFEASPARVVDEMIRIADVTGQDVVYDLGCGDGRIVISAAKKTGCRGVGTDLDPRRIRESRDNALKEGQAGRIVFLEQDLFKADLGEATVVMLFLSPDVNLRVRPKLLDELKPGARVVSHWHTMDEWVPEKSLRVNWRNLHFWVIPAKVEGTWEWEADLGEGPQKFTMELKQLYQRVSGSISSPGDRKGIRKGKLKGPTLTFSVGKKAEQRYQGTVSEAGIRGVIKTRSGGLITWEAGKIQYGEKTATAKRQPASE